MHQTARPHVLSPRSFDELLGGGGGPATVDTLRGTERSWRLLVVRALLDSAATAPPGPLPPLEEGWRLLCRAWAASEEAREAVEGLLGYPAVGVWASHTLRRLRGTAQDDAPLWADTGHLHAIAAAAAVRAGLEFRAEIPVRHGWAVLPALGAMRVPGPADWDVAEVSASAGRVRIAGRPLEGPDWHALTKLRAAGCTLLLDDTDPYRDLRKPGRVEPVATAGEWQELFAPAWDLLRRTDTEGARALARGLVSVVPRPRAERFRPHSASSGEAFGGALASAPDDAEQFASTLVHEFQHNKLSAFMHLFTLYDDRDDRLHYAPWRDDPRPLGGLLQGVYAFFGVTAFWRRRVHVLGQFEFALWRCQTAHTLRAIGSADGLNELGRRLVAELARRVEPWLDEPVDVRAKAAAALAVADHRASWRAHHLRPAAETVRAQAAAWSRGEPLPRLRTRRPSPAARTAARTAARSAGSTHGPCCCGGCWPTRRASRHCGTIPAPWSPARSTRTSPWSRAAHRRPFTRSASGRPGAATPMPGWDSGWRRGPARTGPARVCWPTRNSRWPCTPHWTGGRTRWNWAAPSLPRVRCESRGALDRRTPGTGRISVSRRTPGTGGPRESVTRMADTRTTGQPSADLPQPAGDLQLNGLQRAADLDLPQSVL
ncbi:aKG-HExxH-type peptide beta-hydroxylase [Streptomyces sp. LN325]|uniref:aKG-HExxH-type peptide beta-hydroxylase n=1 Tax=Streptomyces sp. LN325 TaxID=3112976 RepID=UPI0037113955